MNRILKGCLIVYLLTIATSLNAQDIIILKNGEEIKSTVLEIETDVIKYKKFENSSGPTYTILKSEVFMIKYENGEKDVFETKSQEKTETKSSENSQAVKNQSVFLKSSGGSIFSKEDILKGSRTLNNNEIRAILNQNSEALYLYDSGKQMHDIAKIFDVAGWIMFGGEILYALAYSSNEDYNSSVTWGFGGAFFSCWILDCIFTSIGNGKIKSSVELFNSKNNPYSSLSKDVNLNFGLTSSGGVGFSLTF